MPDLPLLVWKKSCDTCRRYKAQLDAWGVAYQARELNAEPLSAAEVRALMGDRPVKPWLNSHNAEYRRLGLKDATPDAETAATLIAGHNNLLRRPVLVVGGGAAPLTRGPAPGAVVVLGNDLAGAAAALGRPAT